MINNIKIITNKLFKMIIIYDMIWHNNVAHFIH
jgi:hypothetical protein